MGQQEVEPPGGGPYIAPKFAVTLMTLPNALPLAACRSRISGVDASCVPFAQHIDNVGFSEEPGTQL